MDLRITNETAHLKTVVLGLPDSNGPIPTLQETYDSKSYESVLKGHYPTQKDITFEMNAFKEVLLKYNIEVLRPNLIENCNQIFARDLAFVIDDKLIRSNVIPNRAKECKAYNSIFENITPEKIYQAPPNTQIEGGDVVLFENFVFVGVCSKKDYSNYTVARTNINAIYYLKELFPKKEIISFELIKHNTNPLKSILHLDCTFMPVGKGKAIVYKDGFVNKNDCGLIEDIFGKENIYQLTQEQMYYMNPNIFSISPEVVVIEQNFNALGEFLEKEWGMTVERIPYHEISKMGGLLRCSTMPLIRE